MLRKWDITKKAGAFMGMTSISDIFRIGSGPSSSHTMAPEKACLYMLKHYPNANAFRVTLFGSFSRTGKGHRTDYIIAKTFGEVPSEILWDFSDKPLPHPNTMEFVALKDGEEIGREIILSIGGGAIRLEGEEATVAREIYGESTFSEIASVCIKRGISLPEYVFEHEPAIGSHLETVWRQMCQTVENGLRAEGELPGGLNVRRRAAELYRYAVRDRDLLKKERMLISAYAYAASEENASGGRMVTSPTCGASGVLPAVLCYEHKLFGSDSEDIVRALAVAGLIGQLIRTNASVSGAEAGCQAEVGSACSMAAAALCQLRGFTLTQIESAAEIAMEHCLGLTCDPVNGLVQIPCIERNAVGALRAYDAASLSEVIWNERKISFDMVVQTMYETGKDLSNCYRETSEGGLAKLYVNKLR